MADDPNGAEPVANPRVLRESPLKSLRTRNERLVLSLIRRSGPMAKAEIARISGLSAQTVSVIMRALEAEGLLIRGDPVRGKVGQPSVPMRLAADGAYFLGLKVGRRSAELVLTDFNGVVVHRAMRVHSHPTPDATIAFAHQQIAELTSRLTPAQQARIAGLGIAIPFFLWNWARHLGVEEQDMATWRDADIRAELAARYDFPVFLENDASAACGAEVVFGPADSPRDFLYFYVGYFIGGGIVLNGTLYTGRGNSGALGPLPVPGPDGRARQLIDVASLLVLEAQLRAIDAPSESIWMTPDTWTIEAAVLARWTDAAAAGLAHAVVSACAVIDFEAVLIDGWIPESLRGDLVAAVDRHLDRHDMTGLQRPDIRPGSVGADARSLGAACLPLTHGFLIDT